MVRQDPSKKGPTNGSWCVPPLPTTRAPPAMGGKTWGAAGSRAGRLPFWEAWLWRAWDMYLKGRSSSGWRWAVPTLPAAPSKSHFGGCGERERSAPLSCPPEVKSRPHSCSLLRGEGGAALPLAPAWGRGEGPPLLSAPLRAEEASGACGGAEEKVWQAPAFLWVSLCVGCHISTLFFGAAVPF